MKISYHESQDSNSIILMHSSLEYPTKLPAENTKGTARNCRISISLTRAFTNPHRSDEQKTRRRRKKTACKNYASIRTDTSIRAIHLAVHDDPAVFPSVVLGSFLRREQLHDGRHPAPLASSPLELIPPSALRPRFLRRNLPMEDCTALPPPSPSSSTLPSWRVSANGGGGAGISTAAYGDESSAARSSCLQIPP